MDRIVLEAKVEEWGQKCGEYASTHGEENPEYLYEYGKALFTVAKLNSSLVDSQKIEEKQLPLENPKVKIANFEEIYDEGEVEEKEEEEEEDDDQRAESVDAGKPAENNTDSEATAQKESKQLDKEGTSKGEESGETAEEAAAANDEEDDEDDFVAAFQIVDLARVILEKKPKSKENDMFLAKVRELLGDISLEDDNAAQATEDYAAAVQLKRELYGDNAGEVSEAEFMLSLAHDAAGNQQKSLEHLKLAAQAAEAADLPSAAELKQRAKDVEQDLKSSAKLAGKDTQQAKEVTQEGITGRTAIANAVQSLISNANDITQLTRKRKRDDAPGPSKK